MTLSKKDFIAMIPADGWFSIHLPRMEYPYYSTQRLVGFVAQGNDPDFYAVVGVAGSDYLGNVEEEDDFYTYMHINDMTPNVLESFQAMGKAQAERTLRERRKEVVEATMKEGNGG